MANEPVGCDEPAAGLQDSKHIAHQRMLVRNMNHRVLAKHDIEALWRKGERTRPHFREAASFAEAAFDGSAHGCREDRVLDVDAGHMACRIFLTEKEVDTA